MSRTRSSRTKPKTTHSIVDSLERGRRAYMAGDFVTARKLWLPLAEGGDADAQAWIGSLYANGDGVEIDDRMAFHWYSKAAEQGNRLAQNNIGAMYAMGKGVEVSLELATDWFTRAAENGDPNSQFNLAMFLTDGRGVTRNLEQAAKWYRKAAEKGHFQSQSRLGHMYATGQGVQKDRVQAFVWLSLASQHGVGTALQALENIVKHMSTEEKMNGMRLVDEWRARMPDEAPVISFTPIPS